MKNITKRTARIVKSPLSPAKGFDKDDFSSADLSRLVGRRVTVCGDRMNGTYRVEDGVVVRTSETVADASACMVEHFGVQVYFEGTHEPFAWVECPRAIAKVGARVATLSIPLRAFAKIDDAVVVEAAE